MTAPDTATKIADDLAILATLFAGYRIFINSREKTKQPEGRELYDECIAKLLDMGERLRAIDKALQEQPR